MPAITVHPEVRDALDRGAPVVALESAVITAGLPTEPHTPSSAAGLANWNTSAPTNLEAARATSLAVRDCGAIPALTAMLDGSVHIGLPESQLTELVEKANGAKATVRDFGVLVATGGSAGTTVAGTLRACAMLGERAIRVMATGGIGGVHHTWPEVPDVSADLVEIAQSRMCIVCSGPKSVLNVAATMEMLETLSVPLIGFGTDNLPGFVVREHEHLTCHARLDTPAEVAVMCTAHWDAAQCISGVLVAQPVAADVALDRREFDNALREANRTLVEAGVTGANVTPRLLHEIASRTEGRSLDANLSLLESNARLAGRVAAALNET